MLGVCWDRKTGLACMEAGCGRGRGRPGVLRGMKVVLSLESSERPGMVEAEGWVRGGI